MSEDDGKSAGESRSGGRRRGRPTPPSERLLLRVFEESSEGILITDTDGKIIAVNKGFEELTGYSRREIIGMNPKVMKSGVHDESFYAEMWRSLAETGKWQGEVWDRRKDGELFAKALAISSSEIDEAGTVGYLGIFRDVTEEKQTSARLEQLAHFDQLTGLPNRVLFVDRLKQALARAERNGLQVAVMFLDLDGFKKINDSLGHRAGDRLLEAVANRLAERVRETDTLARLGGDEFTVVVPDVRAVQDVIVVVRKITGAFEAPFVVESREVFTSPSIGISLYPFDGGSIDELLKNADTAMYAAKEQGKGRYRFYSSRMYARAAERLELETELRHAIDGEELVAYYQPQVDVVRRRVTGCEALVRWRHPERGMLGAEVFVPLAEESGLIGAVGLWMLEHSCRQIASIRDQLPRRFKLCVNVAASQIHQGDFTEIVDEALGRSGLSARSLCVEITESSLMEDTETTTALLEKLSERGVRIALDDFGTGYSSLAYLKDFPFDYLKIPRDFIEGIPGRAKECAITRAIIAVARSLGLGVIAEGVEREEQYAFLADGGCDEIQGHYFSRALELSMFREYALLTEQGELDL